MHTCVDVCMYVYAYACRRIYVCMHVCGMMNACWGAYHYPSFANIPYSSFLESTFRALRLLHLHIQVMPWFLFLKAFIMFWSSWCHTLKSCKWLLYTIISNASSWEVFNCHWPLLQFAICFHSFVLQLSLTLALQCGRCIGSMMLFYKRGKPN